MNVSRTISPCHASVQRSHRHKKLSHRPVKSILLAEDDNDLRLVMECVFISLGYQVVACADAFLAITAFQKRFTFDLLVTDLQMPGMSGLELAREITLHRPTLPVVLVTGSILTTQNVGELVERGWSYLAKPCDIDTLKCTVHRLLNREMRMSSLDD